MTDAAINSVKWSLLDAEKHESDVLSKHDDVIPGVEKRQAIAVGDGAQLGFVVDGQPHVERLWVQVTEYGGTVFDSRLYRGTLVQASASGHPALVSGAEISFGPEHVLGLTKH